MIQLVFSFLVVSAMPTDKTKFEWKPVVGQKGTYTTVNRHKADMGGGEVDLNITWNSVITVKKVDGERVTLDLANDEPKATVDGESEPGIQAQVPDEEQVYSLDGKFASRGGDHGGPSAGLYAGFLFPKSPLEVGEEYEVGGVRAKYVGTEKVGEWDAHKFTFTFMSTKSRDDLWTEGTIWFSVADLSLVNRAAVFHNIDFGMGNENVTNEIVRTK